MSPDEPALDVLLRARGPGPSVLASCATALLVEALVQVRPIWTYCQDFSSWEAPPPLRRVAAAAFVLACGALVAVVARIRNPVAALLGLLSGCMALIAVAASGRTCDAVGRALGGYCVDAAGYWALAEHHWVWFPIAVLSLVAPLAPVLLVAQGARRKPTIDARARVAFGLGTYLVAAAVTGALLSVATLPPLLALTIVGALLLGGSLLDVSRRARALAHLVDGTESPVTPARDDDPGDLPSLAIFPSRLPADGVVRVDEPVRRDAYRAPACASPSRDAPPTSARLRRAFAVGCVFGGPASRPR